MYHIAAGRIQTTDTPLTHDVDDCILAIIKKYFPPGKVIVFWRTIVSLKEENYEYVPVYEEEKAEDRLLREIHEAGKWPVEISPSDSNFDFWKSIKFGVNSQHGAYLLYTSCRDEATELGASVFAWQMEKLSLLPNWNPRAPFLVILTCDRAGNNNLKLSTVKKVFLELQHVMVYNASVLVEISPQQLQCFTWFPYNKTAGNCEEIRDVTLLDTWVSYEGRGMFLDGSILYPVKFPTNIGRCPLRVSTTIYTPYTSHPRDESHSMRVSGLEPLIIEYIAKQMSANVEFRQNPYNVDPYALLDNDSDIAIGNMNYDTDYIVKLEFTDSHFTATHTWYVPRALPHPQWISLARAFVLSAWLLQFLAVILSALLMRYLSRSLPLTVPQNDAYRSTANCVSISCSVMLGVSVPTLPLSNPLRVIFFFLVVFCMVVNSIFQSHITSLLVEPGLQHQMDNFEELTESSLNVFISERIQWYFYYTDIEKKRIISYNDTNSGMQMFYEDRNSAIFLDSSMSYLFSSIQNKYHALSENSLQLHSVMIVKKGWPFLKQTNRVIRRLVEGGIPNKIMNRIISSKTHGHEGVGVRNPVAEYSSLSIKQLQVAFLLLCVGLGVSLLAFVVERVNQISEYFRTPRQTHNSVQRFRPRRRKLLRL
jgi:ABC-type amino acid transport substrate-binding protein